LVTAIKIDMMPKCPVLDMHNG